MHKLIKYITFFVLFTILTKTYVFWADLLHVSVAHITSFFFFTIICLIFSQSKNKKINVPKRFFIPLVYFLIISPFLVAIINNVFLIRVLNSYSYFIFYYLFLHISFMRNMAQKYRLYYFSLRFYLLCFLVLLVWLTPLFL